MPVYSPVGASFRGSEALPDPFLDVAALTMPTSMADAFVWCERVFERLGVYRSAVERIIAYFLTEVQLDGADKQQKDECLDFLENELHIKSLLTEVSLDYLFYGNSLTSMITPIKRYLSCPNCGMEAPLTAVAQNRSFHFAWESFQFRVTCPRCEKRSAWHRHDRRAGSGKQLFIKRWAPQDIEIMFDPLTERCHYIWKIDQTYRQQVRAGELIVLETANWEIIEAVRDNKWLKFDDDFVYHMKEPRLAGQINRGWGLSRALTNLGITYYVQTLHKYNESLALDYVMPFRVITPELKGGPLETEPAFKLGISTFVSRVNGMVRARRHDPTRWNVLPFPIRYQALGGDATSFTPKDLIDQGYDVMFNAIGCPVEFYRGNLSSQAAVPMLRIFESHHQHFRDQQIRFLQFVVNAVIDRMGWEKMDATLLKPRHADDISRQQMQLQLGINRQISQTTSLRSVGLDFEEETRRKLEEEQFEAEATAEKQEETDQQQAASQMFPPVGAAALMQQGQQGQPGQPGAAGAPAGGGAAAGGMPLGMGTGATTMGPPKTPEEYTATAQQIAQQLLGLDETTRKSQLAQLRQQDPVLQRLVIDSLEKMRYQMRMQGGQMLMQQGGGGAPPA